ncbi:S1/P1 nuclease [Isosphaeraceae bacterium EP7]
MTASRNAPRTLILLCLAVSMLASSATEAVAWGPVGHRASAMIAEFRLSKEARAAIRDLLEPGESLADASTWADEIRGERRETGSWHYVNVPITDKAYSPRHCSRGACVVSKIEHYRDVLGNKSATKLQRREALRFLVHFIQDIHQPLHVGDRHDKGGNDLQLDYNRRQANMHQIWDSGLIRGVDEVTLARALVGKLNPEDTEKWAAEESVEVWANESLEAARDAYINPENGAPLREGDRLGPAYTERQRPMAHRRISQAGVRTAAVLNEIFGGEAPQIAPAREAGAAATAR